MAAMAIVKLGTELIEGLKQKEHLKRAEICRTQKGACCFKLQQWRGVEFQSFYRRRPEEEEDEEEASMAKSAFSLA